MDKKYYQHEGVYSLPAWKDYELHWDGIYLDAELFENNIPILDCTVWLSATPQGSYGTDQWLDIGFPTFTNGQVVRLGHQFRWIPYNTSTLSQKLSYNGNPYGMGLNTIAIQPSVLLVKHYVMSWHIHYIMEVWI